MPGKACYQVWRTNFEIDERYQPIKAVGKGAYGVVCSAKDQQAEAGQASDKVAIKKITNAFENLVDARRTLREMKLLRYLRQAAAALAPGVAAPAGTQRAITLPRCPCVLASHCHRPPPHAPCPAPPAPLTRNPPPACRHENVIAMRDIMRPPPARAHDYSDVYIVYELMDTDLHQIIRSTQPLSDDHLQYFVYQVGQ